MKAPVLKNCQDFCWRLADHALVRQMRINLTTSIAYFSDFARECYKIIVVQVQKKKPLYLSQNILKIQYPDCFTRIIHAIIVFVPVPLPLSKHVLLVLAEEVAFT